MILIVDNETYKIIKSFEAWDSDSMEKAMDYIQSNDMEYLSNEINLNGDMVMYVLRRK